MSGSEAGQPTYPWKSNDRIFVGPLNDAIAAAAAPGQAALPLAGGTMTGPLVLSGPPTAALGAADKAYVDAGDASVLVTAANTYQPILGYTPYNSSNPAGYQTAAQVTVTLSAYLTIAAATATYQTAAEVTAALAPYALTSSLPVPATVAPIIDGTAAIGVSTLYARQDHIHPTDTSRAAVSALPVPATAAPLANGVAAIGSSALYARQDHVHPAARTQLAAALNLYVSPGGLDTNSGLSSAAPFLTLQHAWNVLASLYDLNGYGVTINVAAGTYTAGLVASGRLLGQIDPATGAGTAIAIVGASSTTAIISPTTGHAIEATNGARISVSGLSVASASGYSGLLASNYGAIVMVGAMNFGACGLGHMYATTFGSISNTTAQTAYSISGGTSLHLCATVQGQINLGTVTVTVTVAVSITNFAYANLSSLLQATGQTYTLNGAVTGTRYSASLLALIYTGSGANASYFPGSTAGAASTGALYE